MTGLDLGEVLTQVRSLPEEAQEEWLKRVYALRQDIIGSKGPLGVGTRKWASPGALAAWHEPTSGRQTPQLELLDRELVDVADGRCDRLMFYMPPQEGKSQRVSRRFAEWLLQMDPTLRIVIVSYEYGRARRWGRYIKRDSERNPDLGIRLARDATAAGSWQTTAGGGIYCVGIGGSLTGEPADVIIIDDPVKGRAEAESVAYREAAWDWWEGTGKPRLSDRGRVVLIMTRWHEDDLAGRLLKNEPGVWRVVGVPAVAEHNDPIGRAPGEAMVSVQRRPLDYYTDLEATTSLYVFLSIYQQRPTAAAGNLFKRNRWKYWRPAEKGKVQLGAQSLWWTDLWRFATVDLAASTKKSADWTVVSAWGMTPSGDLMLLDRVREQVGEEAHSLLVLPLVARYGLDTVFIERGFIGTTLVVDLTAEGVPVTPLDPDTDKTTRAIPAANRQRSGRIWLPAGRDWLDAWIEEHAQFPNGEFDDQVDTTSYAARVSAAHHNPVSMMRAAESESRDPAPRGVLDLERAVW